MAPNFDFEDAVTSVALGQDLADATARLYNELSQEEKLSLLDGDSTFWKGLEDLYSGVYFSKPYSFGAIPRLKFPGAQYVDGPRGVNIYRATAFPVPMARGATWDVELERRVAKAIGLEARALGANLVGSCCINLPRHPAWGRVQETYSEDPFLLGEMGAAHVHGLQANVMACVKHYALNSMEFARFRVNVVIDDRTLHEVYLPHFRRCAEEGAACFMTAYNAVNGEWAGQHQGLIKGVLYEGWNFQGFTISDWVFGLHDGVKSVKAGLTLEAPFANCRARAVKAALQGGDLEWSDIEHVGRRLLSSVIRHYVTREKQEPGRDVVLCSKHRALAREVATRSIVLLKNDPVRGRSVLPLTPSLSSCAVIGRLANSRGTGDSSSSMVNSPDVVSPYEGLKRALPRASVKLSASDSVEEAVRIAKSSEVAVLMVGYDDKDEGEFLRPSRKEDPHAFASFPPYDQSLFAQEMKAMAEASISDRLDSGSLDTSSQVAAKHNDFKSRPRVGDRKSVRLRPEDIGLIEAVTNVQPCTIVAIVTAGAVITEGWRQNVSCLMIAWYNGCEAGSALADVLLGKANPSGRLPWSMPQSEGHLPPFDPFAHQTVYDKWVGQRRLDRMGFSAAYPLGYGISYTSFSIQRVDRAALQADPTDIEKVVIRVKVINAGLKDGTCVVQVYGRECGSNHHEADAVKALVGFRAVEVSKGQAKVVKITVSLRPLQSWNRGRFVNPASDVELLVGQHAADEASVRYMHTRVGARI